MRSLRRAAVAVLVLLSISAHAAEKKPNIVVILIDDMGFSDLGAYGGEIKTPNIDALAASGTRFQNFHVAATCSPTRSMLLTGADNHQVGYGNMQEIVADNQRDKPGYEGRLNGRVATVATLLQKDGYDTYMVGKWHLGKTAESRPDGQGFTRSLALMESGADNWENKVYIPTYDRNHFYEGKTEVQPPKDYYSSTYFTDKLIEFIKADEKTGRPFFAYLAFQAVHYPHQAPAELTEKYVAIYEKGWDAIRKERFERQKKLGLIPADLAYVPAPGVPAWDSLPEAKRRDLAKRMAVYAAMAEAMDRDVGRLVAFLKRSGEYDDTAIIVLSDNGPDATDVEALFADFYAKTYDRSYERLGQKGSFSSYGPGWAAVSATPFANYKGSASEGGLRVPMIVSYPKVLGRGARSDAFGFVTDIVPTILDLAGDEAAARSLPGKSLVPILTGKSQSVHGPEDVTVYELAGSRAVFRGNDKLVMNFPPYGDAKWRLYDYVADPQETNDLSATQPEVAAKMRQFYDEYAKKNGFVEVPADYTTISQMTKNTARANAEKKAATKDAKGGDAKGEAIGEIADPEP